MNTQKFDGLEVSDPRFDGVDFPTLVGLLSIAKKSGSTNPSDTDFRHDLEVYIKEKYGG